MGTQANVPNPEDYVESAPVGAGGATTSVGRSAIGRIKNLKEWLKKNPNASQADKDAAARMMREAESTRVDEYKAKQFSGR